MTVLLAPAWAGLLLAGAWWWRPPAARIRQLAGERPHAVRPPFARALGGLVRRRLSRPADPVADARLGRTLVVGLPLALLSPPVGLAAALLCWAHPVWRARRDRRRAEAQVVRVLPDVVDLLGVAVAAGCTAHLALRLVAPRAGGPLGVGLREVVRRSQLGERNAEAVEVLCAEAGEVTRPLVVALQSAERYGSPLGPALERLSAEARAKRRRQAEIAARRTPVRLLFPLVLCTLPAFALLTVVPLLAGSLSSLRP